MKLRKTLAALALGALLLTGTAAACGEPAADGGVEVEDCDAEDYANRESDCGFTDADRAKRKTPAPRKPAPRQTRK